MTDHGWSKRHVADELGVSPGHVSRISRGENSCSDELTTKLEALFRLEEGYFDRVAAGEPVPDVDAPLATATEICLEVELKRNASPRVSLTATLEARHSVQCVELCALWTPQVPLSDRGENERWGTDIGEILRSTASHIAGQHYFCRSQEFYEPLAPGQKRRVGARFRLDERQQFAAFRWPEVVPDDSAQVALTVPESVGRSMRLYQIALPWDEYVQLPVRRDQELSVGTIVDHDPEDEATPPPGFLQVHTSLPDSVKYDIFGVYWEH
jgi:transcriptional regulator with XRE-family HTH domain